METRPGSPGEPTYPVTQTAPEIFTWDTCTFIDAVRLRWFPVSGAVEYEIRFDQSWGKADGMLYKGNATEFSFRPSQRAYTVYGATINAVGNYSVSATKTLTNTTPSTPPQPVIKEFFSAVWIEIQPVADNDILGYNLYMTPCDSAGSPTGPTEKTPCPGPERVTYKANVGSSFLVQVSAVDVIGEGAKSAAVQATTRAIDNIAQFAQTLRPPRVVDKKPTLPSAEYPVDSVIYLTTDSKLYKNVNNTWSGSLGPNDYAYVLCGVILAGAIGVDQLAANAVTVEKLAAGSIEAYVAAVQQAFIDSAHIISLEADKIKIGGGSAPIPLAISPGDTLFRFDGSLLSTQGLKPLGME